MCVSLALASVLKSLATKNLANDHLQTINKHFRQIKNRCSLAAGSMFASWNASSYLPICPGDTWVWRVKTPLGWTATEHGRTIARKFRDGKKVSFVHHNSANP
jgi:hypothetical protein